METKLRRASYITIILGGIALFLWTFGKVIFQTSLPFFVGAIISSLIHPVATAITKATKIPLKLSTACLVLLLIFSAGSIFSYSFLRLIKEAEALAESLPLIQNSIGEMFQTICDKLSKTKVYSILVDVGIDPQVLPKNLFTSLLSSLTNFLPKATAKLTSAISNFALSALITLFTSYYLCAERDTIKEFSLFILPAKATTILSSVRETTVKTLNGYIKACLSLMLLTFVKVFIGLTLLRVRYAFLLSVLIAIVDILPLVGSGLVLIPWAAYSLLFGDTRLGIGLLVLYVIVLIVRRIAEPKIIGRSVGLHPFATIASTYIGIKFFGVAGIILGPLVTTTMLFILKNHNTSN